MSTPAGTGDSTPAEEGRRAHPAQHDAAAAVHDLLTSFFRLTPRDMSLTSVSVLAALERNGPRRITEIAAAEGITQPSVTTLVSSLAAAGYVERRSDPGDRRVVIVAVTEAGAAYLRTRRAASTRIFADAVAKLSPEDAATLAAAVPVVERLRDHIDEQRRLQQAPPRT